MPTPTKKKNAWEEKESQTETRAATSALGKGTKAALQQVKQQNQQAKPAAQQQQQAKQPSAAEKKTQDRQQTVDRTTRQTQQAPKAKVPAPPNSLKNVKTGATVGTTAKDAAANKQQSVVGLASQALKAAAGNVTGSRSNTVTNIANAVNASMQATANNMVGTKAPNALVPSPPNRQPKAPRGPIYPTPTGQAPTVPTQARPSSGGSVLSSLLSQGQSQGQSSIPPYQLRETAQVYQDDANVPQAVQRGAVKPIPEVAGSGGPGFTRPAYDGPPVQDQSQAAATTSSGSPSPNGTPQQGSPSAATTTIESGSKGNAGLNEWREAYKAEHGFYPGEGNDESEQEALANKLWSEAFAAREGRPPDEREWRSHYWNHQLQSSDSFRYWHDEAGKILSDEAAAAPASSATTQESGPDGWPTASSILDGSYNPSATSSQGGSLFAPVTSAANSLGARDDAYANSASTLTPSVPQPPTGTASGSVGVKGAQYAPNKQGSASVQATPTPNVPQPPNSVRATGTASAALGASAQAAAVQQSAQGFGENSIIKTRTSRNFNERPANVRPDAIVLHATAGGLKPSLDWLGNTKSNVSAHYVVGKNGQVYQMVDDSKRAWHAGESSYGGRSNWNDFSIGIEIENANDGKDQYTPEQVAAIEGLVKHLANKHKIQKNNIVTHSQIAPHRKSDPQGLDVQGIIRRVYG